MLVSSAQLSHLQQQDLTGLMSICQQHDGGLPSIYHHLLHQKRESSGIILYYQEHQLIGFISVYFFWQDACEISLLIAPAHRQQGIARCLLQAIMPLICSKAMQRIIFSAPPNHLDQWLPLRGFIKQASEFHLERINDEASISLTSRLTIQLASINDINHLYEIDAACFPVEQINMVERFHFLLNNKQYTLLIAHYDGVIMGKAHLHWQPQYTLLSDIAIHPLYQKQGFGSELLSYCINYARSISDKRLALDVEADNQQALSLYQRHGFAITNGHDYWSLSLARMIDYISS